MMNIKTYSELITLPTFEERFCYLKLDGSVGKETFGFKRWLNQEFYHSDKWLRFRDEIIIRDEGCDLGVPGYEIFSAYEMELQIPHRICAEVSAQSVLRRKTQRERKNPAAVV